MSGFSGPRHRGEDEVGVGDLGQDRATICSARRARRSCAALQDDQLVTRAGAVTGHRRRGPGHGNGGGRRVSAAACGLFAASICSRIPRKGTSRRLREARRIATKIVQSRRRCPTASGLGCRGCLEAGRAHDRRRAAIIGYARSGARRGRRSRRARRGCRPDAVASADDDEMRHSVLAHELAARSAGRRR